MKPRCFVVAFEQMRRLIGAQRMAHRLTKGFDVDHCEIQTPKRDYVYSALRERVAYVECRVPSQREST